MPARRPRPRTARPPTRTISIPWPRLALFGALLLAAPPLPAQRGRPPAAITVTEPLPALLARGAQAFAAGDYPAAAEAFSRVEIDYGAEPEWRTGALPQKLLPLRGFAQLRAGAPAEAAASLAAFLERFPDDADRRGFALYALALALHASGDPAGALTRFEEYEREHAGSAQAALARFQRAELSFALGRDDDGLALLRELAAEGGTAASLRTQARLRALERTVELRRDAEAAALLLDEPWSVASMPEIAVLALAAMEIGDRLLAAERPGDALRAYRLVLPKARLVEAQRERLEELESRFAERAAATAGNAGAFWADLYRARIARLRGQLTALEAAEDHTAPLRLRVGQAFLLAGRGREAWLVFEHLAFDPGADETVRGEAHYRWILAAAELGAWDEALAIARAFTTRFPGSPQADEALHLIARAHLEQRRLPEADEVLGDLLDRRPPAAVAERARFTRGWVRTMREDFAGARADFDACLADHPTGPLALNAALWRALSRFFERDHAGALAELEALEASAPRGHPLLPEIRYRRATTLYAMRAFDEARGSLERFVAAHPGHPRRPEAIVLLGDVLMGMGLLDEARARFAEVEPEAVDSFAYGVFQTGKILRTQGDHAGMVEFFSAYARRADLPTHPRLSEALHWIGWAEEQRGRPGAALPVYLEVLERFGDDPAAPEVGTTLASLGRLVRRIQQATTGDPSALPPAFRDGFEAWLVGERERVARERRHTLWARLTLARADLHRARKEPHQAEALELGIAGAAPVEALDAAALARVGLALLDVGSPACAEHFERLVTVFPASFERAAGFYGLASLAADRGRREEARRWLARFDTETPTHPLAPRAALLAAATLERTREYAAARSAYEDLLRLKSGRGRPHAEALMGLARCGLAEGDARRAVAYFQRVYTLHRAQTDLAADAYLRSGELFADLGDLEAAAASFREMLGTRDIGDARQREAARRALAELEPRLATPPPVAAGPTIPPA